MTMTRGFLPPIYRIALLAASAFSAKFEAREVRDRERLAGVCAGKKAEENSKSPAATSHCLDC
jgi:hypothetical protein